MTNSPIGAGGVLLIGLAFLLKSVDAQSLPVSVMLVPGVPVRLFDGRSLNGWARRDGTTHPGWDVVDGALHRKAGGGDLYYQYELADFELRFQWKISAGGNSGLKYRVRDYNGSWLGCEYQLLDDNANRDANKTAGLYDVIDPPDFKPVVKPEVWNDSRIVVCGNCIEHWLNGIRTVSVTVGSPAWKKAVAASKFANNPDFGENRVGRLFLQDHGDEVWFREIVLVPLSGPDSWVRSGGDWGGVCTPGSLSPIVVQQRLAGRLRLSPRPWWRARRCRSAGRCF
jgi:hypothetical protein